MYIDGLGSSTQIILTTWKLNKFTRPEVDLYPVKLVNGFRGHRFILSAIENPPLVFRRYLPACSQLYFLENNFSLFWANVCFDLNVMCVPTIFSLLRVDKDLTQAQSTSWDGVEIRLLQLIAEALNFTLGIHDATFSKSR